MRSIKIFSFFRALRLDCFLPLPGGGAQQVHFHPPGPQLLSFLYNPVSFICNPSNVFGNHEYAQQVYVRVFQTCQPVQETSFY